MKKRRMSGSSLTGAVVLFFSVAAVVSVTVAIFAAVTAYTQNKAVIAAVMLTVIVLFALLYTLADCLRRKLTVDRPVGKILTATDKIASGDFSARLDIVHAYNRYDGYDYIMENLNKMAAELQKTEVLHTDFISNVSHELKTPLAVIQNYAVLLQDRQLDAQERMKYAKTLAEASRRLTALITNILKLNKLENQELKPERELTDLGKMLAESVLGFEELIEKKQLQLECGLDEEVKIFTVPSYLEIVWNNLISNAVKFTEAGGTVGVTLEKRGGSAVVRISDTGCGISAETGRHIFEKFYQGDTSHAQEGNGLGLALVKKVIDIIGGKISVESRVGKGTVFTVTLAAEEQ